jgi:uncharacterized protein (TIGR02145 family)
MKKTILIPLALIVSVLVTWLACDKEQPEPPVGNTNKIMFDGISITPSYRQAHIDYTIENINKNDIESLGICYNNSSEPTLDDNTVSLSTSTSGTKTIDGLSPNTEYYFRLYAEISGTTIYSDDKNFSTNPLEKPSVTTTEVTNIDTTSATSGGNIKDNGGLSITARGICWSTSQNPTINDNNTSDGSGTGSFTSELTGLSEGTEYYVRAYATNDAGTAYGEEISFLAGVNGTFTDSRDEQTYEWVRIGDQVWMAENLNYDQDSYGNDWCYGNNSSNCDTYGRLYDWAAVMQGVSSSSSNPSGVQGVCPDGWHVPSDEEWTELENYVSNDGHSGSVGTALKSTSGWNDNGNGTDDYGFSGLPGGARAYNGNFFDFGYEGHWWSATNNPSVNIWSRSLESSNELFTKEHWSPSYGFSIRCLRD